MTKMTYVLHATKEIVKSEQSCAEGLFVVDTVLSVVYVKSCIPHNFMS